MESFKTIIDGIGIAEFAKLVGVEESHVRAMKTRDSIPAEYWGQVLTARPDLDHTKLRAMRKARFAKSSEAA